MAETRKGTEEGSRNFSDEEREAMKERAKESRSARSKGKKDPERDVFEKIAEMDAADKVIAEGIHAIVKDVAPELQPKTWYGQPAYAKDGKTVVFFQAASKFKTRYATLGFQEDANLDDGDMWATSFAVVKLTPAVEKRIRELVKQAAS